MAPGNSSPTVRHRTLTIELRRLREEAGLTRDEVAEQLDDFSVSKVMRYETGRWRRIQTRDVRDLLDLYGVADQAQREAYMKMAKEAREPAWWRPYSDILKGAYVGFENEASAIQTFEPAYIPGLFQTEDYARALLQAVPNAHADQVDRKVTLRTERQKLLHKDDTPELWAVVDEPAIRRPVGGRDVMADQLRHLVTETSALPHVTLQVLPFAAGAHAGMDGAFTVLTFPDPSDRPVVYLETATEGTYPESLEVLHRYTLIFNHLRAVSLSPSESTALIEEAARDL